MVKSFEHVVWAVVLIELYWLKGWKAEVGGLHTHVVSLHSEVCAKPSRQITQWTVNTWTARRGTGGNSSPSRSRRVLRKAPCIGTVVPAPLKCRFLGPFSRAYYIIFTVLGARVFVLKAFQVISSSAVLESCCLTKDAFCASEPMTRWQPSKYPKFTSAYLPRASLLI